MNISFLLNLIVGKTSTNIDYDSLLLKKLDNKNIHNLITIIKKCTKYKIFNKLFRRSNIKIYYLE